MTHTHTNGPEHDFEPVPGLPADLPKGEKILWQGRPATKLVSRRVMKVNWFAGYFAVLLVWTLAAGYADGRTWPHVLFSAGAVLLLSAVFLGMMELFAWGVHKTTLYTITNKRVVMRIGVALSATFNLPFAKMVSADLRLDKRGGGDIALTMAQGHRLSFFSFWPHVRGYKSGSMVPQMICLKNAQQPARILADALSGYASVRIREVAVAASEAGPAFGGATPVAAE
ncbi:photosynthetic complex assembly protein [Roseibium aquae]|uniref:Photosynthetic complex assembly protein n=1 Tax=Roseibium aquae TaxID=1323746 RepID=A0A916T6P1_9HYPH|nr:photosynthetic complex putative assembly protein PuhB [Roseibium aquae]GGB33737.1 photosynthetic complex assembly protein [Roseibium aquae]